jgi:hypothetical protein
MASVNKVILMGNAGRDPEVRYLPSGSAVATVTLATSTRRKDKTTGEMVEETQWHRLNFFDRLAEICGEYVKKGSQSYLAHAKAQAVRADRPQRAATPNQHRVQQRRLVRLLPQLNQPRSPPQTRHRASMIWTTIFRFEVEIHAD